MYNFIIDLHKCICTFYVHSMGICVNVIHVKHIVNLKRKMKIRDLRVTKSIYYSLIIYI